MLLNQGTHVAVPQEPEFQTLFFGSVCFELVLIAKIPLIHSYMQLGYQNKHQPNRDTNLELIPTHLVTT